MHMSKKQSDKFYWKNEGMYTRISVHDRFHVEIKTSYSLARAKSKHQYRYDVFMFIPKQLGFNSSTYKTADFFNDSKMYTRLESLNISLKELSDVQADGPLAEILAARPKAHSMRHEEQLRICDEVKLYGASFSSAARQLLADATTALRAGETQEAARLAKGMLLDVQGLVALFDKEFTIFFDAATAPLLQKTFTVVRAYISFEVEVLLGKLLNAFPDASAFDEDLSAIIESERKVRAEHEEQWAYLTSKESNKQEREGIWYDYSLFKKIVTSCLHLNENESRLAWTLSELMMGFAAAIAMAFALFVAVISTQEYAINSLPWLIIAVIAYMFKDRIKEYLRSAGVNVIQPFVPDRKIFLETTTDVKRVAVMTDKMLFPKLKNVDKRVMELRQQNGHSVAMLMPGSDEIMQVTKEVTAHDATATLGGQSHGIASIARFDVRRLLSPMDDPMRVVNLVDPAAKKTVATKIPNVYHVPLIVRYQSIIDGKDTHSFQGLRLVLDQSGIRRLEALEENVSEWAKVPEWDLKELPTDFLHFD